MKVLLNLGNGAFQVVQDSGQLKISIDKSLSPGGGKAAGILSIEDKGSVVLDEVMGLRLLAALAIAHSPSALQAIEQGAETLAEGVVKSI